MMNIYFLRIFLLLLFCLLCEAEDETVRLQEVEGTNITLHPGMTGIQRDAQILWFYGPKIPEEKILFSHVFKGETDTEISERFKERLQLDRISGALTIRNISRNDSGLYLLQVITGRISSKTFSVRVYAPVSAPVIRNQGGNQTVSSTEPCFLLCSVENGEDVKLSWYRENERISITNNTDLSVPLSLPLQLHPGKDTNTYSCVSEIPKSSKQISLNITQLCSYSSDETNRLRFLIPALMFAGVLVLIILVTLWILQKKKKHSAPEEPNDLTYADVMITAHSSETLKEILKYTTVSQDEISRTTHAEEDRVLVVYSDVKTPR